MHDHVIDPESGVARGGYVMPGGMAPDGAGRPEALPRGEAAPEAVGDAAGTAQPMWGWGDAPAVPTGGEDVATVLTRLPSNPTLYTARQQDAARRDIAGRLGSYAEYQPQPFISD